MFQILLYYKYTNIADPEDFKDKQVALCQKLNLKGRVIIASEGINGTLGGLKADTNRYIEETKKYPGMEDIEWKVSTCDTQAFPKLRIVIRDEIVTLGLKKAQKDINLENTAEYIEPNQLKNLYEKNEDFVIIDARNEYESRIGKFKNAIAPNINNFRDFPEFVKKIENYKDKQVITYCTGGIRCEKASAYLKEQGFKNVKQLHGGIHEYSEQAGGENFDGEMYVFDSRVHTTVNHKNPTVISICTHCKSKITRYINCSNKVCNKQIVCCKSCEEAWESACSIECKELHS